MRKGLRNDPAYQKFRKKRWYEERGGRERALLRSYGLTKAQWEAPWQHGCGICGSTDNLVVDHDHRTGKVRGVLCRAHNAGLGIFDDDPNLLRRAIRWLEERS